MAPTPPAGRILALDLDGHGTHPASWRASAAAPDRIWTGAHWTEVATAAELAGFTAVTFSDGPREAGADGPVGRLHAVHRAAFVAPSTTRLALVPEVDPLYTEPFHTATQLASLDILSGGRAGWIPRAGTEREAAEVAREPLTAAEIPGEVADVVRTARLLWDSWEDGAVIRDTESGRYLDRDRIHHVDAAARRFRVKGPAITPRPPQGTLPVLAAPDLLSAGASEVALVTAAGPAGLGTLAGLAESIHAARAAGAGRVLVELEVVLDARGQSGAARLAALDAHVPWDSGRARFVGSADGLVALLSELLSRADGVRLFPAVLDVDLDELRHEVMPRLRDPGLLGETAPTLRDQLDLPVPANTFAS